MPTIKFKKWSKKEINLLKRCSREHKSLRQASEVINRTPAAIETMAGKFGLPIHSLSSAWGRLWTDEDDRRLRKMAKEGKTILEISKETGRSRQALYNYTCRNHIEVSLPDPCHHVNISKRAMEILDGVLLGDGCITPTSERGALLSISQASRRVGWMNSIKKELRLSGMHVTIRPYKNRRRHIGIRVLPEGNFVHLRTRSYAELFVQRKRWYGSGKKRVPRDIRLTPLSVAHWFSGDGYGVSKKRALLGFCTEGFSIPCVNFLIRRLREDLGVESKKYIKVKAQTGKPPQYYILINKIPAAHRLASMMRPYLPACCQYKLRFVRHKKKKGKLSDEQVLEIRRRYQKGELGRILAKEFSVCKALICLVGNEKRYQRIGKEK